MRLSFNGKLELESGNHDKKNGKFIPGFGGEKFGNNFFSGASPTPESLVSKLMTGTSVSLFGLRRIGKSSLLAETRERLLAKGRSVVWVDLDTNDSLVKALSEILNSIQHKYDKNFISRIKKWTDSVDYFPADFKSVVRAIISGSIDSASDDFGEKYAEALFRETGNLLKAQESDNKPIIIFDDLTTLIKYTIDRADAGEERKVVARLNSFLGLLRHWRKDSTGITMAVSGSVSLHWLKRNHGIRNSSVNDCVPIWIRQMSPEATRELVELCVKTQKSPNWNEECINEFLKLLPAHFPGVVQLAYSIIESEEVSAEALKGPLRDLINKALWEQYFEQFHSQFANYGSSERCRADKLFEAITKQDGGIIQSKDALNMLSSSGLTEYDQDGRELLHNLISDSYVDLMQGGIGFSSGLVPAWREMR